MQKMKVLLILICLVALFANFSNAQTSRKDKRKAAEALKAKRAKERGCHPIAWASSGNTLITDYSCPPVIDSISLSQTEVVANCGESACAGGPQSIEIKTEARDPDGDTLLYVYEVSGGEIVGSGSTVVWSLAGAKPGTYKITVFVDDGCGMCMKPVVKEIKVVECPDCDPPPEPVICPITSVTANRKIIKVGETVTFTANTDLKDREPIFNWRISSGEIVSGQGTPMITVKANSGSVGELMADVTIKNIDPRCGGQTYDTVDVLKP